jgi:hypothetical protein
MSILKVKKETTKLINREAALTEKEFSPGEIFIITDSKGKYIKPVIPGTLLSYVHVIYKSGANISSNFVEDFIKQVRRAQRPIVYIWFGTCELTEKSGKYIHTSTYPYQQAEHVLTIYREIKQRISHENSQSKVIFIECPFLSVYRWNKHQRREHNTQSEEIDKKQDTELKSIIKYFNNQLNLINRDWTTPKISQDQIISSKEKRISHANYKINYNLLFDGIHPRRPIARLWLHRLVKYARDLR